MKPYAYDRRDEHGSIQLHQGEETPRVRADEKLIPLYSAEQVAELEAQLSAAIAAERVWETTMMQVCGEDGPASVAAEIKSLRLLRDMVIESLRQQVKQFAAEAAQMKAIIDSVTDLDNEPHFHEQGMGCGLEDRGITDRYEAMRYGWDQAMERVYGEVIPCAEDLSFPGTDAFLSRLRAEGVETFAQKCHENSLRGFGSDPYVHWKLSGDHALQFARQMREGRAGEVQS